MVKQQEVEPLADEERSVILAGVPHVVKRLSVRHVFKVGKILGIAISRGGVALTDDMQPEQIATALIAAVPFAENDVLELLSSLVGITPEAFGELPPEALLDVLDVVAKGEDLKAFFTRCVEVFTAGKTLAQSSGG